MALMSVSRDIVLPQIEPEFEVFEEDLNFVGGLKEGQSLNVVISFEVVEKTKSFTILRINFINPVESKRVF